MGEAPDHVRLIQTVGDAETVEVPDPDRLAYATQTTLSQDDVSAIVRVLQRRFPTLKIPESGDICYATQNRQEAVTALVKEHQADTVLVVGSPNSSNSNRLREVALQNGARAAYLIGSADELQSNWLDSASVVGISAGASTPERLVSDLIERLRLLGARSVRDVVTRNEDVFFSPPPMPGARKVAGDA